MGAAELNDVLVLGSTVGGLVGVWYAWGRKWWAKRVAARAARVDFREKLSRMVSEWQDKLESVERHMASVKSYMADSDHARTQLAADLQRSSAKLHKRLDGQDSMLDLISAQLWAARRFSVQAEFQCDVNGRNVQVNAAYANMMRVGEIELTGFGWKNRVVEEDRHDYEAAAEQAFQEHRKFERTVRFQRGDGTRFRGRVRLEPFPESLEDLVEGRQPLWFGSITLVEELG